MKNKKVLISLLVVLIGYGLYQVYVFYLDTSDSIQSIYLVPKDAVYIIETQKPIDNWAKISESDAWQHLQQNSYFNQLTKNLNKLDTIFKQKKGVLDRIGNRELLISAHVYSPKKYGFFYVIDLQKIAKLNLLKKHLNTLVNSNFKISKRKYHEHEITEVYDVKKRETLYICFIKNQFIASYTHTLVEASIDQYLEPTIGRDLNFIEVKKEIGYSDLFRLYFQYDYLDDYVHTLSNKSSYLTSTLSNSLNWSGFRFKLDDNTIVANGTTNTKKQASTYLKALQKSGKGERTIPRVTPKETAFYLSFSFSSFSEFYENFERVQKEDPEKFRHYIDGTEKVENFLDIDLKAHFMSWIDNEMALLQMHSSVSDSRKNVALVLKTKDINDANNNLNFILSQIRKKSPVKFKAVAYKGHTIKFMSIKGFFKLLLGNLFEDIEKPYYTTIEDYVIFSNDPNTLKTIINKYEEGETLANFEDYKTFNLKFNTRSSVFAFVNTPSLYNNVYDFVDPTKKKELKSNKDYFICFPQLGLQLIPDKSSFDSKIAINYESPEVVKTKYLFRDSRIQTNEDNLIEEFSESTLDKDRIFNIPELFPPDLTAREYIEKYSNGHTKFSVQLKDGLKHGKYRAYYRNGVLKISGRFRKDKQQGTWRAYNLKKDLVFKKRF